MVEPGKVGFHLRAPRGDRRHYVDEDDVAVVLSRLPPAATARLRAVHFTDDARGNRRLGYTTTRGRREIALCALPPRVSSNTFVGGPHGALAFGAVRGAQWPSLAVRRFMLCPRPAFRRGAGRAFALGRGPGCVQEGGDFERALAPSPEAGLDASARRRKRARRRSPRREGM